MQVERRSGLFSPAEVLERVFEGGIVIDASDRLAVAPEPCLMQETNTLCAEVGMSLLRTQRLRRQLHAKKHTLRSKLDSARKARFAARQMIFETMIVRCAFEQARRDTASV